MEGQPLCAAEEPEKFMGLLESMQLFLSGAQGFSLTLVLVIRTRPRLSLPSLCRCRCWGPGTSSPKPKSPCPSPQEFLLPLHSPSVITRRSFLFPYPAPAMSPVAPESSICYRIHKSHVHAGLRDPTDMWSLVLISE